MLEFLSQGCIEIFFDFFCEEEFYQQIIHQMAPPEKGRLDPQVLAPKVSQKPLGVSTAQAIKRPSGNVKSRKDLTKVSTPMMGNGKIGGQNYSPTKTPVRSPAPKKSNVNSGRPIRPTPRSNANRSGNPDVVVDPMNGKFGVSHSPSPNSPGEKPESQSTSVPNYPMDIQGKSSLLGVNAAVDKSKFSDGSSSKPIFQSPDASIAPNQKLTYVNLEKSNPSLRKPQRVDKPREVREPKRDLYLRSSPIPSKQPYYRTPVGSGASRDVDATIAISRSSSMKSDPGRDPCSSSKTIYARGAQRLLDDSNRSKASSQPHHDSHGSRQQHKDKSESPQRMRPDAENEHSEQNETGDQWKDWRKAWSWDYNKQSWTYEWVQENPEFRSNPEFGSQWSTVWNDSQPHKEQEEVKPLRQQKKDSQKIPSPHDWTLTIEDPNFNEDWWNVRPHEVRERRWQKEFDTQSNGVIAGARHGETSPKQIAALLAENKELAKSIADIRRSQDDAGQRLQVMRAKIAAQKVTTPSANQYQERMDEKKRLEKMVADLKTEFESAHGVVSSPKSLQKKIDDLQEKLDQSSKEVKVLEQQLNTFGETASKLDMACMFRLSQDAQPHANLRELLRPYLEELVGKLNIPGTIQFFGSRENGFGSVRSDIDVTIIVDSDPPKHQSVGYLQQIYTEIQKDRQFFQVLLIAQAKVPVLKMRWHQATSEKMHIEIDLCVNNALGVENTKLLKAYCNCDPRVSMLGRLVKNWAKRSGIVGSQDGYFNSYAYVLMVIFFLQTRDDAVVPNLQASTTPRTILQDGRIFDVSFSSSSFKSTNPTGVVELFRSFLQFYGEQFDWNTNSISIPHADVNRPHGLSCWSLEDPFDKAHNLAKPLTKEAQQRFLMACRHGYAMCLSGAVRKFDMLCMRDIDKQLYLLKCVTRNQEPDRLCREIFSALHPDLRPLKGIITTEKKVGMKEQQFNVYLFLPTRNAVDEALCVQTRGQAALIKVLSESGFLHAISTSEDIWSFDCRLNPHMGRPPWPMMYRPYHSAPQEAKSHAYQRAR